MNTTTKKNGKTLFSNDLVQILNFEKPISWRKPHNFFDEPKILSDRLNIGDYLDIILKSEKL